MKKNKLIRILIEQNLDLQSKLEKASSPPREESKLEFINRYAASEKIIVDEKPGGATIHFGDFTTDESGNVINKLTGEILESCPPFHHLNLKNPLTAKESFVTPEENRGGIEYKPGENGPKNYIETMTRPEIEALGFIWKPEENNRAEFFHPDGKTYLTVFTDKSPVEADIQVFNHGKKDSPAIIAGISSIDSLRAFMRIYECNICNYYIHTITE